MDSMDNLPRTPIPVPQWQLERAIKMLTRIKYEAEAEREMCEKMITIFEQLINYHVPNTPVLDKE